MEEEIEFLIFGDCALEEGFIKSEQVKKFYNYFNRYDFITFNLETVVSNLNGVKKDKAFNFKTEVKNLRKFKENINIPIICNIANNHIFDYGNECFEDTIKNLKKLDIKYTGISENTDLRQGITYINIKSKKIAIIGAFNGDNVSDNKMGLTAINEELLNKVEYAKGTSDIVIVHLHWGQELSLAQTPNQVKFAHKLINKGANLIIGHHPHVIQATEIYKKSLIIYSLGNFQIKCSDNIIKQKYSNIIKVNIDSNKKIKFKKIPIFIKNNIPQIINLDELDKIIYYDNICNINKFYLSKNSWVYFYCESSKLFIEDSFLAWKIRKQKKEKFLYLKFIRWFISINTMKMILANSLNKLFKIREKVYERC